MIDRKVAEDWLMAGMLIGLGIGVLLVGVEGMTYGANDWFAKSMLGCGVVSLAGGLFTLRVLRKRLKKQATP